MSELNGVSVIVCCYNSENRITPTLEHLQHCTASVNWEVIVVDNNSTDRTADVVEEVWKKKQVVPVKIVQEKTPGLMHARIRGVSVARYDILSFIDDDNWVDKSWIDNTYRIFSSDASIGACGGESIPVFESEPPAWFTKFQNSFAVGKQQDHTGYVDKKKGFLWGAGLSIRKVAWQQLFDKGFSSRLSGRKGTSLSAGEDSEICFALLRKGWRLWYDESLKLRHFIPTVRLTEEYLKKMYKGFGEAEMILSVYRMTAGNENPSWISQLASAIRQLIRSGFKSIFSSGNDRFNNTILYSHDKAYVSMLIANRSEFYNTVNSVKAEVTN